MRGRPARDLAVVCAENLRGYNAGMLSVDRAAVSYFKALGRTFDLCLMDGPRKTGKLRYRNIESPAQLAEYRSVVYWGDFQINPMWGRVDVTGRLLRRKRVGSAEEAIAYYVERYLDIGRFIPESSSVHAVGQCMLGAGPALEEGPAPIRLALQEGMTAFWRRARQVIVRDPVSFAWAHPQAPGVVVQGVDCAFLQLALRAAKQDYFIFDFGRCLGREQGAALAEAVAGRTGLRAIPIRWLGGSSRWRVPGSHFNRMARLISGARFALTDIYHLCVNALVRRTPPFCLSRRGGEIRSTLSDAKKEALFAMLGTDALHRFIDPGPDEPLDGIARWVAETHASLDPEGLWATCDEQARRMRSALDEAFA